MRSMSNVVGDPVEDLASFDSRQKYNLKKSNSSTRASRLVTYVEQIPFLILDGERQSHPRVLAL